EEPLQAGDGDGTSRAEHVERVSFPVNDHALQGRPGVSDLGSRKGEKIFHKSERQNRPPHSGNDREMGHGGSMSATLPWSACSPSAMPVNSAYGRTGNAADAESCTSASSFAAAATKPAHSPDSAA